MTKLRKETLLLATISALSLTILLLPVLTQARVPALAASAAAADTSATDRAALLQGVDAIRAPGGLVATLTLLGDGAFPVITGAQGKDRAPVVAAARAGRGRVVVYGHGNFIGKSGLGDSGTAQLLLNAVRWSASGKTGTVRVGLLQWPEAAPALKAAGFIVTTLTPDSLTPAGLRSVDVLLGDTNSLAGPNSKPRITAVQNWVRGGGGLITMGVGWGWQQLNPGASLANDSGFNRLLVGLSGIGVNGGTADPTGPNGAFTADGIGLDIPSADGAITKLETLAAGNGTGTLAPDEIRTLTRVLVQASDVLPDDDL